MNLWETLLELVLVALLAVTLIRGLRLERAITSVRNDRREFDALVQSFNEGMLQAEQASARLRTAAEGVGRQLAKQTESGVQLKDDLLTLIDRGERLADRLDSAIRAARDTELRGPRPVAADLEPEPVGALPRLRSQAERDLLRALRVAR
jgi:hypothetical protein